MKLYNLKKNQVLLYGELEGFSEEELNLKNLYIIEYKNNKPDLLYYNYSIQGYFNEVTKKYEVTYLNILLPIEDIKVKLLGILTDEFHKRSERPIVPISLGFNMQGGIGDLDLLERGKKREFTVITDADDITHLINPQTDYDIIINEIENYGLQLLMIKWNLRDMVTNAGDENSLLSLKNKVYNFDIFA